VLVTLVTPSLNAGRYFPECLRSIAAQTYPRDRIQHVVADGGSSDETISLARAAGAEVDVARDRSLYDALNRAVRFARGDVVGWINADDEYAPDALARVVSTFEAHPEADLVIGDYTLQAGTTSTMRRTRADVLQRIRRGERRGTWVTPLAVFYRTGFLRALGEWLPQYRGSSDLDLWIRAAAREPLPTVVHVGAVLGRFRVHPGSISTGASPERSIRETLEIARRWRTDSSAPAGVRRFALYLERHYGLALRLWEVRDRLRPLRALAALSYWFGARGMGPGSLGDLLVPFE
jgi:glycosyltransferase involved in cell wall biosynthesis